MTVWFSADWHLGHAGIFTHQAERAAAFECLDDMDAQILDRVNSVLRPGDELFFLGDFAWQASRYGHYRQRVRVRKFNVVRGNHDSSSLARHCSLFKDMLLRKFQTSRGRVKIHMLHCPMLSWYGLHHGSVHLYGHSHGRYEAQLDEIFPGRRAMDVGIDNVFRLTGMWRPISLEEVVYRLNAGEETEERVPGPFED